MNNSSQTFAKFTLPEGIRFIMEALMKGVLGGNFSLECTTLVNG